MRLTPARLTGLLAGMLTLLALAFFALGLFAAQPARAQNLGLEITKTLRGGPDVQIGQILEFTIRITNTGSLALVEIDLVDEFVGSIVAPVGSGPFAEPGDPPLSDTPFSYDGVETITWNLLGGGATLSPGQSLAVVVRLRAVHPTENLQTVNRARIARAISSSGQSAGQGDAAAPALPSGSRMPMEKIIDPPFPVVSGMPITYTIRITNDGMIDIVTLPLNDVFNPAALHFRFANPPPDQTDQVGGRLTWKDLLASTGRTSLGPGESITVQTVYTALRDITQAVNRAEVVGAKDEYGNDVAPREAQVPIRIVGPTVPEVPTATPTRLATAGPRLTEIAGRTATARAQPTLTLTPTSTATVLTPTATVVMPATLPNTAGGDTSPLLVLLLAIALLGGALALRQ